MNFLLHIMFLANTLFFCQNIKSTQDSRKFRLLHGLLEKPETEALPTSDFSLQIRLSASSTAT
jgi:hypothetical protein